MLNFIAIGLQLYEIFKITRVSFLVHTVQGEAKYYPNAKIAISMQEYFNTDLELGLG